MRYLFTLAFLFWSTACVGQESRYVAGPNSWIVVIGAVSECPAYDYQVLDVQYLKNRTSVSLVGASMNDLTGLSGEEIETELQSRDDLALRVLPNSLKVLIYKAGLSPKVLKKISFRRRVPIPVSAGVQRISMIEVETRIGVAGGKKFTKVMVLTI